jgi:UDP-N-acetylglucosamine--N-acetylmuramyl-(pentapeptide) pyrophosphoryl-undecaprenol N-acetylglucosamine transferase
MSEQRNTSNSAVRVIISGGGTGGHIFPAVAIANAIKRLRPDAEILFVGAMGKMEMEKVPAAGYRIIGLNISGIERSLSPKNLLFPIKLAGSLTQSMGIIRNFRPDAVVGVGGFASGPVMLAATVRGIPTIIQEQNSYAGITNKVLGRRAKRICVAYPEMGRFFPSNRIVLTGNPVRQDILNMEGKREAGLAHLQSRPNEKNAVGHWWQPWCAQHQPKCGGAHRCFHQGRCASGVANGQTVS